MSDCPCTRLLLVPGQRTRTIGFVSKLEDTDARWPRHHAIFVHETPQRSRHGRARVICCADPGWTRIGGSTAVLYGKNTKQLLADAGEVSDPNVIVLLYPGTRASGGALAKLADQLEAAGRTLTVHSFDAPASLHVDPQRAEVVQVLADYAPPPPPPTDD